MGEFFRGNPGTSIGFYRTPGFFHVFFGSSTFFPMNYEAFLAIVGQSTIQKLDDAAATRFGGQVGDSDIVPKKCTYKASSDRAAI